MPQPRGCQTLFFYFLPDPSQLPRSDGLPGLNASAGHPPLPPPAVRMTARPDAPPMTSLCHQVRKKSRTRMACRRRCRPSTWAYAALYRVGSGAIWFAHHVLVHIATRLGSMLILVRLYLRLVSCVDSTGGPAPRKRDGKLPLWEDSA